MLPVRQSVRLWSMERQRPFVRRQAHRVSAGVAGALRCAGRGRASFSPEAAECRSRTLCSAGAVAAPGDVDFLRGWTRMRHRSATESCGQESGMERSVNRTPLRRNLRCGRLPRVQMVRRRCAAACCKTAAQGVQRPAERGALSLEGLGYCVLNGGAGNAVPFWRRNSQCRDERRAARHAETVCGCRG